MFLNPYLKIYILEFLNNFMNIEVNDLLEKYPLWYRATIISGIKNPSTLNDIASLIGDSVTNSYFYNLIKFLEENKFILIDKSRVPHSIKVDNFKLASFLREGIAFKQSEILIKETNLLGIYNY